MEKHYVISVSTEINRHLFEGDMDAALTLIAEYMRKAGLKASFEAVTAIPMRARPHDWQLSAQ
jgi:predicted solute-binding protein